MMLLHWTTLYLVVFLIFYRSHVCRYGRLTHFCDVNKTSKRFDGGLNCKAVVMDRTSRRGQCTYCTICTNYFHYVYIVLSAVI